MMARRHILRISLTCLGLAAALLAACAEVDRASSVPFEPPLLKDRDTSNVIRTVQGPLALPFQAEGELAQQGFAGVTFETQGDVVWLALRGQPEPADRLAIALYGPRTSTGTWGKALLSRAGHDALDVQTPLLEPGRYLVLVGTVEGGSTGGFLLSAECEGECAQDIPDCVPATECSLVCPLGFVLDANGCETCACITECQDEFDCPSGEVCSSDFECVPSCQCNQPFAPVCGADGSTYANACEARCAGVSIVSTEPCSTTCAPEPCELSCANGYAVDASGCELCACRSTCGACTNAWAPVCSANGLTYLNRCLAECDGNWVAYLGTCHSGCPALQCATPCAEGVAMDSTGCPTCDCAPAEPCSETAPVCGTDGVTYENACAAASAEVAVVYDGPCPGYTCAGTAGCPVGTECVKPDANAPCLINGADPASCLGVCVRRQSCDPQSPIAECPSGYDCLGDACQTQCLCSGVVDPVCGEDGITYDNTCVAACAGVAVAKAGRCCEETTCTLACSFGLAVDRSGCAVCTCLDAPPCACSDLENPVCAMFPDGTQQTYLNRCWAQCDGFSDAQAGPCP